MSAENNYDDLAAKLDAHAEATKNDTTEGGEKKSVESQASTLVAFVRDRCRLVHDENGEVCAVENGTGEVRNIERKAFKTWLHAEFYTETKKAARSQSVAKALTTLAGIGLHDGEAAEVHIRCAQLGGGYVIDLGEPGKSRAIVVRPGGWTVTEHHGVMFTRPESMKALPEPTGGGTLDADEGAGAAYRSAGLSGGCYSPRARQRHRQGQIRLSVASHLG